MRNARGDRPAAAGGSLRRALLVALCIAPAALLAGGCAKAKAASVPDGPPLAVPAAPARVLAPVDEPLAATPPAPEPAAAPPRTNARPAPAPPPRRPAATATTEPEPKPEPAAQTPPPAAEPPAQRAAPTPADAAADRKVRDVMRRAAGDLGRVNYQRLSADGKAQYEQSKRFHEQAEQALKDRNYAFAATLADKAAALATELLAAQ